jgi:phosphodiesterase/alkaline phosphatase D-like protein
MKIAEVIQRANPDFVLHCGDLVYQGFNDRSVDWRLFNYYQGHMARVP